MAPDPPPTSDITPPPATNVVTPTVTPNPVPPRPANGAPWGQDEGDWATHIADTIDQYVGLVRDKATRPAILAARGLVFGVILAILGVTAIVLLWIALTTGITALTGEAWITDLILGGIFVVVGAFLMSKRRPKEMDF